MFSKLLHVFSLLFLLVYVTTVYANKTSSGCKGRDYGHGSIVCVCDASHCDSLAPIPIPPRGKVTVVTSTKDGRRWDITTQEFVHHGNDILSDLARLKIEINRTKVYQAVLGFGGAFTDAATMNIMTLPESLQNVLLRSYYSHDGLEYSMGRVPAGGTDFSTRPYTYDDLGKGEVDITLSNFSLAPEDVQFKIPIIKRALAMSPLQVKLIGSAWSAPAWMKDNSKLSGKGKLIPKYYSTWAEYYIRFIKDYKAHGVTFWGLTAQNEPSDGLTKDFKFNAMGWTAEEQAEWIGRYLGPKLHNNSLDSLKVMILDDNRLFALKWVDDVMKNERAAPFVSGVAIHWYTDWLIPAQVLDIAHKNHPNLFLLYTEACAGQWPWQPLKVVLGSWVRAQNYAADIIENLQHWVTGWIDWNLALDVKGGPNWIKNFVDSPIIVNAYRKEFYKQPMFYALAHFTKALPEGSRRVDAQVYSVNAAFPISHVAFIRPDNATVLILLNKNHIKVDITVIDQESGELDLTLDAHSITTLTWV